MKLSLICEANHEAELAKKIIELIGKAHGTDDHEKLRGQVWTSTFFTAPKRGPGNDGLRGEGAGMEEDDLRASFKAGLIVSAEGGNWKLSDKAFKLAGGQQQGLTDRIMGGAPGFSDMARGVSQLKDAMRGGK